MKPIRIVRDDNYFSYKVVFGAVVISTLLWVLIVYSVAVLFDLATGQAEADKAETQQRHSPR